MKQDSLLDVPLTVGGTLYGSGRSIVTDASQRPVSTADNKTFNSDVKANRSGYELLYDEVLIVMAILWDDLLEEGNEVSHSIEE